MNNIPNEAVSAGVAHQIVVRVGHELVGLVVAAMFCAVEALVLMTEIRPARLFRKVE